MGYWAQRLLVKLNGVEYLHDDILALVEVLLLRLLSLLEIEVNRFIWWNDTNWVEIWHGNLICRVKSDGLSYVEVWMHRHLLFLNILEDIILCSLVIAIMQLVSLHIHNSRLVRIIHHSGITILMYELRFLNQLIIHSWMNLLLIHKPTSCAAVTV